MKDIVRMTCALVVFSTVACVALAFVYDGTAKTIAIRQQASLDASLKSIFPDADSFQNPDSARCGTSTVSGVTFSNFYLAEKDGSPLGLAIQASGAGFNDEITALVGVKTDGTIAGVKILTISDTPGLGANAASPTYYVDKKNKITFTGQFTGKKAGANGFKVVKDGGGIVAITAATITSRAVTDIVSAAAASAAEYFGGAQ